LRTADDIVDEDIAVVRKQIFSLTSSYVPELDKHSAANLFNYRLARLR